jgi:hypothetical protein
MSQQHPAYFFTEALRTGWKERERERHFRITSTDVQFLRNLSFSTDAVRRDQVPPMIAQHLWLNKNSPAAVALAGSFMMSSTGNYTSAFLYTPYGGLEKFTDRAELLAALSERLKDPDKADELLQFVAMGTRRTLRLDSHLVVTPVDIEHDVFDEQKASLEQQHALNLQEILAELVQLPSLEKMLHALLKSVFSPLFPTLDPVPVQVSFFKQRPADDPIPQWVNSFTLTEALLLFYRQQAWPVGQTREYFHPHSIPASKQASRWDTGLQQASRQLVAFLKVTLETFWNTNAANRSPRREFFAQVMAHRARIDLLLKRQEGLITPAQAVQLAALYLPAGAARSQASEGLRFETVRYWIKSAHFIELTSTVMIGNAHTFLYSPAKGLSVLLDQADLEQTLRAMTKAPAYQDDVYNYLSLEERVFFMGATEPQVSGNLVVGNLFEHLVNGIIDKQQQSLVYVLEHYRRERGEINLAALLDHALDVRVMLDHQLLALDTDQRWTTHSVLADPTRPVSVAAKRAELMYRQLRDIPQALERLIHPLPSLASIVSQSLLEALRSRKLAGLDPAGVYINRYRDSADPRAVASPLESQSLVAYFIKRMTQDLGPVPLTPDYGIYGRYNGDHAAKVPNLDVKLVNQIFEDTLTLHTNHDIAAIPREHLERLLPQMGDMMSNALPALAHLLRLNNVLDARDESIIGAVFDPAHPDRSRREDLKGFIPDVYCLTVERDGHTLRHRLANCLMITERGGLDHHHSGRAVLWTPAWGLESFASAKLAQAQLEQRMADPVARLALLENLDPGERRPHARYTLGAFWLITEPVAVNRQQSWIDHYIATRAHALAQKSTDSALLSRLAVAPRHSLEGASQFAHHFWAQRSLPAWLGMAPPEEQRHQAELLEQYRRNTHEEKDYLYECLPLYQQVQDRLSDLLQPYSLYPEHVFIIPRLALGGERQTITQYALRHLNERAGSFTVDAGDSELGEARVQQLLATLNIAKDAKDHLLEKLAPGRPEALEREQRFIRQLPWQLLQHAHALKLQEQLSDTGYGLIRQIVDMPDAVARATIAGATARLRPLELIATPGASIAKSLGSYLIDAQGKGPLILYTPYHPHLVFKEFENEAQLLGHLNQPGQLQDWIVTHLGDTHQATYKNLLASTQDSTSEISLAARPIQGHAIKQLYQDNRQMMAHMLEQQNHPQGQSLWDTVKRVLSHGVERIAQFLPGKLRIPLVVWQSYTLFKDSAEQLQLHHWRKALQTFIHGCAHMATLEEWVHLPAPKTQPSAYTEDDTSDTRPADTVIAPTLRDLDVTDPRRTRLQSFEVTDIALTDLHRQSDSGLYASADGASLYAPVEGKVYPIKRGKRLQIASQALGIDGPLVASTAQQRMVLDPYSRTLQYGLALRKQKNQYVTRRDARMYMDIEATGMEQIRQLYPHKAMQILEALDMARFYGFNAMHNLVQLSSQTSGTRLDMFLKHFFDTNVIDDTVLKKVRDVVIPVCQALVNPDLDLLNSSRFVIGRSSTPEHSVIAFVITKDMNKQVFFTELFFDQQLDYYKAVIPGSFNVDVHAQAATLIHEFAHHFTPALDICQVGARRPFHDLIETITSLGKRTQAHLRKLQDEALSLATPRHRLFSRWNQSTGSWDSMDTDSSEDIVFDRVKKTTASKTVDKARDAFMDLGTPDARIDTILNNADSIAHLICVMGRQLDPTPPTP